MQIEFTGKDLSDGLEKIVGIIPMEQKSNAISIEKASSNSVSITVVREGISAKSYIQCEKIMADEGEKMVLDGVLFTSYIKQLSKIGKINIDSGLTAADIIEITYEQGSLTLNQLSNDLAGMYPAYSEKDLEHITDITGNDLKELVNKVSYAINKSDNRIALKSIRFESDQVMGTLTATATDGFRIALGKSDTINGQDKEFLVLGGLMDFIAKGITGEKTISLHRSQNVLIVNDEDALQIIVGLTGAAYPNLKNVINTNYNDGIEFECTTSNVIDAIKRVGILSNKSEMKAIKFSGDTHPMFGNMLKITSKNEKGNGEEQVIVKMKQGDIKDLNVALNSTYLLAALEKADDDISFKIGQSKPITIENVGDSDVNYLSVILPIRVSD